MSVSHLSFVRVTLNHIRLTFHPCSMFNLFYGLVYVRIFSDCFFPILVFQCSIAAWAMVNGDTIYDIDMTWMLSTIVSSFYFSLFFCVFFFDVSYCYLYLFCNNIPASVCLQMVFLFFHVDLIKYIIRISPHFIKFNWWKIFRNHPNKKHSANHRANRSRKRYHTMNERQQTSKQKVRLLFSIIGCSIIQGKKYDTITFLVVFFLFWLQNAINENIFFVISSIRTTHGKYTAISLVVSIWNIIIQIAIDSYNTDTNE